VTGTLAATGMGPSTRLLAGIGGVMLLLGASLVMLGWGNRRREVVLIRGSSPQN
jgi:hypothetical protein